ncbi:PTS lactose/cellobiose transporter subunit IIA [Peribacillus frigoritolerans]|nr:PTS lactose/cellobiose transporter subunit IIA [Peribacillus frigoritolerans]
MVEGHHAHSGLIQQEASGQKVEFSLLLMHAEDQMMSAETINDLVAEMIRMYRENKTKIRMVGCHFEERDKKS